MFLLYTSTPSYVFHIFGCTMPLFFMCLSELQRAVNYAFQFPCRGVFTLEQEWWANAFRLNPWAKGCADRDYYLFVMVDVISCRYRMEGLWFIALSTATSRTCALACRMNTALSVLSIRHHHLSHCSVSQTPSHFMPQYINNLSLFWYLLLHICFPHILLCLSYMCPIILMHYLELRSLGYYKIIDFVIKRIKSVSIRALGLLFTLCVVEWMFL